MVLNGLPHSHTMINCSHSHLCFLTPGVCANPVWGPFLCDHDKITIWDILLANFWWSQQLLDHESHVHSQDILSFLTVWSTFRERQREREMKRERDREREIKSERKREMERERGRESDGRKERTRDEERERQTERERECSH